MEKYDILCRALSLQGIEITKEQVQKFKSLTDFMLEYNKKLNLTRITSLDDVIKLHYLDSLCVLWSVDIKKDAKIIDIGTGAGFPGIPLKIIRDDLDLILLDSLNKRIKYLELAIEFLNLNKISPLHARSEELSHDKKYREKFDLAVSRAVAPLPVLCELCLGFVKPGGLFVAYKGRDAAHEANLAQNAIKALGGELLEIKKTPIYKSDTEHSLVIIKKTMPMQKKFPRKNASILKNPL